MQKQFERKVVQDHTDELASIKGSLQLIQNRIQNFEASYLTRNWQNGNILLGWKKQPSQIISGNNTRIQLTPKDKIFSLSSTTSPVNFDLTSMSNIVDRNLVPPKQAKFRHRQHKKQGESIEKKESKLRSPQAKKLNQSLERRQSQHRIARRFNKKEYDLRKINGVINYRTISKQ